MKHRRWWLAGVIAWSAGQSVWLLILGILAWDLRNFMATTSAQEAFGARYAISILAAASVNILGLIAFLIRRRGRLLLVLASVQALNIVFAVIESFITANPGWLVIGAAPATITLVFIYLLWRTDRPTTSAAE